MGLSSRDRSTLLRMAGNIASGWAGTGEMPDVIASQAVTTALLIFHDPRLTVEPEAPGGLPKGWTRGPGPGRSGR
jgi:hypothetical protein